MGRDIMGTDSTEVVGNLGSAPTHVPLRVVPVRHYGQIVFTAITIAIVGLVVYTVASSTSIQWEIVGEFVFNGGVLSGLGVTLQLTAISMALSLFFGVIIASMRLQKSRVLPAIAWFYAYVFRSIPLLVLLIFVGNIGLFVRTVTIGIPFTDIVFFSAPIQQFVNPFVASVIALTLAGSAYVSEIVRGGLLSVDPGQHAAAKALSVNRWNTFRYITAPQALRVIIPPMGNEFIGGLKATSLVSVVGAGDLLTVTTGIGALTYRVIELLIVATIWYFIVVTIFSILQYFLERRFASK